MNLSLASIEQQIGAFFSDAPAHDRPQRDRLRDADLVAENRSATELKGGHEELSPQRARSTDR
ncbi:hypothetical protein [Pseudomonas sp. NPDC096950]|uniref:hypothetical protein n=1 Tax=Pseudomonas sp. NPDC096950 TaxID=3364485 RepID=UPI00383AF97F